MTGLMLSAAVFHPHAEPPNSLPITVAHRTTKRRRELPNEGLKGRKDFNHTGRITHRGLDLYVAERVKELTGGRQHPVTQAPGGVPDFPVAIIER
jgi:hypothetical protein